MTVLLMVITLAWDASSGATGYKLYWGSASKVYQYGQELSNVTQYTVTISTPGTYYFACTARNGSGESAYSNEVKAVIGVPCDQNYDGRVDVLDLQLLATAIVRGQFKSSMDLNNDGRVDVLDLQRLSRVILGVQTCN
jgi:hypothetical protein